MPRETYTTTPHTLNLDVVAQARSTSLVAEVQTAYNSYELRTYGSNLPPDVDAAYVLMGSARVGLNRLPPSADDFRSVADTPTEATFAVQSGTGVSGVSVDVEAEDESRAQAWATVLGVPLAQVLSGCVCTGLGLMAGDVAAAVPASRVALGPF